MEILIMLIPFFVFLIIGVPIAFSLILSTSFFLLITGSKPLIVLTQQMYTASDSFPLMAIPFFVLAGNLMNRAQLTGRLIELANVLVGRLTGGLGQVSVVASMFLAAIIGSATATTAAVGGMMVPAMCEKSYGAAFSGAVAAAGGILGPIIPPSVVFIVAGSLFGVSVGALFMAGIVPGLLIGFGFMLVVYFTSKKRNYPRYTGKLDAKKLLYIFLNATLALMMPIIIMGGILTGVFTATEAGAVAGVYALLVGILVYRSLSLKDLYLTLVESGITSAIILLLIAASNPFGWVLSVHQLPQKVAQLMAAITSDQMVTMLLITIFLLIMGMFLETAANILIVGPILFPIANSFGIDPVYFIAYMCMVLILGMITPPMAVNLFVAAPIAGVSFEKLAAEIWPFLGVGFFVVILLAIWPEIVLFLPRILGLVS